MSDMIKYSVIVPIYNAEKTLNQCLESFAVQLRDDIEILLVNDGSMDKSEGICKSYCEQYPNFRYFYKENGGVSAARNLGLDYAKGEYILFADSDDYVSDKLFETLDEKMRDKPDFYQMAWCEVNGELKRNRLVGSFSSKDETSIFCEVGNRLRNRTLYGPFAKLYKRDIIEKYGLRFPNDLRIGEDAAFVFSYSLHISSFEASDTILYFANIESEESLSRKKRPYLQKDLLAGSEIMLKALSECSLSQETKKFFIMRLHGAIIEMCIP